MVLSAKKTLILSLLAGQVTAENEVAVWTRPEGFVDGEYESELSAEVRALGPKQTCQHQGTQWCRDFGNDCCENGPVRSCSNGSIPVQTGKLCAILTWCYTCAPQWNPYETCRHEGSEKCRDNGDDCCENENYHCADGWTAHPAHDRGQCHNGAYCYRCEPPQHHDTAHDDHDDSHDEHHDDHTDPAMMHHQQSPGEICQHGGSHRCQDGECCTGDFDMHAGCHDGIEPVRTNEWCRNEDGHDHHCYKCEEPRDICHHEESDLCRDEEGNNSCCAPDDAIENDMHPLNAKCEDGHYVERTDISCGKHHDGQEAFCYRCPSDEEDEGVPVWVFIVAGVVGVLICVGCFMALAAFGFMAINSNSGGGTNTVIVEKTAPESPSKPANANEQYLQQQQQMMMQQQQQQQMAMQQQQQQQMMMQQQQQQQMMAQQQAQMMQQPQVVMSPQVVQQVPSQPQMVMVQQQPQVMQVQGAVVMQ